jgi:hypothetical protein
MINYEVYYYNLDDHAATMGIYASKEVAEAVSKIANEFKGEEHAYIREVEVLTEMPAIYTHVAYINFEDGDINNISCHKLDQITIFDIPERMKTEPSFYPTVSVLAHGINEGDAITKVKQRMVNAIQCGAYQAWKDTVRLKAEAQAKAENIVAEKGIKLANGYPVDYNEFEQWQEIHEGCNAEIGLK